MKRIVILSLILIGITTLNGCKLFDELRTFNLNYAVNFTIPSSTVISLPINLPTPQVTTNSEQRFQDEGVESAWIESVKLTGLTITVTSPQGEDFSFLENISIYINTNGQPELLLASKIPVPASAGNTLELDATGSDLYPYISQNDFTLRTELTTDESMSQSIDFRADLVLEVKATIPGGN